MLVFGGTVRGIGPSSSLVRYDPATDAWTALSSAGAPSPRERHRALWTGNAMLVWGGFDGTQTLGSGGSYHPDTDSWTAIAAGAAPSPRYEPSVAWTGAEMLVWGGWSGTGPLGDGGRYRPATNSWSPLASAGAPVARSRHSTVFTGSEMLVWGGRGAAGLLGDGARYRPASDSWETLPAAGAPTARDGHMAVWTGNHMVVWGGCGDADCTLLPEVGGRFAPATGEWTPTSLWRRGAAPCRPRCGPASRCWFGGGYRGPGVRPADTGGAYCSRPGPAIFADGFEGGTTAAWSLVSP